MLDPAVDSIGIQISIDPELRHGDRLSPHDVVAPGRQSRPDSARGRTISSGGARRRTQTGHACDLEWMKCHGPRDPGVGPSCIASQKTPSTTRSRLQESSRRQVQTSCRMARQGILRATRTAREEERRFIETVVNGLRNRNITQEGITSLFGKEKAELSQESLVITQGPVFGACKPFLSRAINLSWSKRGRGIWSRLSLLATVLTRKTANKMMDVIGRCTSKMWRIGVEANYGIERHQE